MTGVGRDRPQGEGSEAPCSRCGAAIDPGDDRWGRAVRRQAFGFRAAAGPPMCAGCHRQMYWLAWRGLVAVVSVVAVVFGLVTARWLLIPVAIAVAGGLWWISGHFIEAGRPPAGR